MTSGIQENSEDDIIGEDKEIKMFIVQKIKEGLA